MPPERDLIRQCLAGDLSAFRRLIEPQQDCVFRIALSILGSREEAEEAAQDTFMRVYRELSSFSGAAPFGAWVYRIAVRTCLNAHRRRRKWRLYERSVDPARMAGMAFREGETPEAEAEQREMQAKVRGAIDRLPGKLHEVVVLSYLDEFSHAEIADLLDIPEGTVKSRLHLARGRLQKELERQGLV